MNAAEKEKIKFLLKFGQHLRKERLKKNISAGELARRCYMDKPNLFRIEKGRVNTSIFIIKRLLEALEISFEDFFQEFD